VSFCGFLGVYFFILHIRLFYAISDLFTYLFNYLLFNLQNRTRIQSQSEIQLLFCGRAVSQIRCFVCVRRKVSPCWVSRRKRRWVCTVVRAPCSTLARWSSNRDPEKNRGRLTELPVYVACNRLFEVTIFDTYFFSDARNILFCFTLLYFASYMVFNFLTYATVVTWVKQKCRALYWLTFFLKRSNVSYLWTTFWCSPKLTVLICS